MGITVHHKPVNRALLWSLYVWQTAWDGNNVWDTRGAPNADTVDCELPDAPDAQAAKDKIIIWQDKIAQP